MELGQFLTALRRRWVVLVVAAALGLGAGVYLWQSATPQFRNQSTVFFSLTRSSTVQDLAQGSTYTRTLVLSYAQVATMPIVLDAVIQRLNLPTTASELAKTVTAEAPLDTTLVEISVVNPSSEQGAQIANAIADQLAVAARQLSPSPSANDGGATVKVETVAPATRSLAPISPQPPRDLALGLLAGLVLGVAVAVVRELLDNKVRGPEAVVLVTSAPVIGEIGLDVRARSAPLLREDAVNSLRAEAFRSVRTNLLSLNLSGRPQALVMTSALPEEGKTVTTINLALTTAELGLRVLVVDADLRRPSVAGYTGLVEGVGLTDVLTKRAALGDVVQSWGHDNLHVMASGQIPLNPSELLGSQRMTDLLKQCVATYDLVLIDGAPLLAVTDSVILGKHTDGALMVVNARKTRRPQFARAVGMLAIAGVHLTGVVINGVSESQQPAYYTRSRTQRLPRGRQRWPHRRTAAPRDERAPAPLPDAAASAHPDRARS